jgi:hypothetical protein
MCQDYDMKPRRPAVKDSLQKASRNNRRKVRKQAAAVAATRNTSNKGGNWTFAPAEIRGEPLSETILQERRQ